MIYSIDESQIEPTGESTHLRTLLLATTPCKLQREVKKTLGWKGCHIHATPIDKGLHLAMKRTLRYAIVKEVENPLSQINQNPGLTPVMMFT